jgi:hypothetical protein
MYKNPLAYYHIHLLMYLNNKTNKKQTPCNTTTNKAENKQLECSAIGRFKKFRFVTYTDIDNTVCCLSHTK